MRHCCSPDYCLTDWLDGMIALLLGVSPVPCPVVPACAQILWRKKHAWQNGEGRRTSYAGYA